MLLLVSCFFVCVYSLVLFIYSKKPCVQFNEKAGKCIPMAYAMVTSTLIGLLITFISPNDFAINTIISIFISFIFALAIGLLFGGAALIEALSASFMGAMMGAMLAQMTPDHRINFIIISMDLLFILFITILLIYIQQYQSKKLISSKFSLIVSILFILACCTLFTSKTVDVEMKIVNESNHIHH